MVTIISSKSVKAARKYYPCDSCYILLNYGSFNQFIEEFKPTLEEIDALIKAMNHGYKILKGESYNSQFIRDGSDVYTFRSIPAIHNICIKYDMYGED